MCATTKSKKVEGAKSKVGGGKSKVGGAKSKVGGGKSKVTLSKVMHNLFYLYLKKKVAIFDAGDSLKNFKIGPTLFFLVPRKLHMAAR
jgi:hypothetical protein